VTDRPMNFRDWEIRALLDGRKTQTRRVIPQPFADGYYDGGIDCTYVPAKASNVAAYYRFAAASVGGGAVRTEELDPHYSAGDRLWVREAWTTGSHLDGIAARYINPSQSIGYLANEDEAPWLGRIRRPTHMPRWASRLTLVVTDVRVQRLQEISSDDAEAEGIVVNDAGLVVIDGMAHTARAAFRRLWDSINAKRGHGWDANPWVCALTFTVHHGNIDTLERVS